MAVLGIRREDKNPWERRAPLTPHHVEELVRELGVTVAIEPSEKRIYSDQAYREAGAELTDDLSGCRLILGVKEVPPEQVLASTTYLCFAHVIKGQPQGMPLLQRMLQQNSTLIDYEPIVDRFGRRLVFFGRHAGYAGMIDALWALGQRMEHEGVETAFSGVKRAFDYKSVAEACETLVKDVGVRIREQRLSSSLHPLVIGFTGGGNVSRGAQEILDHLPVVEIEPDELKSLADRPELSRRVIYKVVFRRPDRLQFSRHLPHLTMLVNGIYWEPGHPKLATRGELRDLWQRQPNPRLKVLADLSCDIDGSIEATVQSTTPNDPVFVFDPESGKATLGVAGRGPVVLAVDNLPAEFPRDSTEHFGDSLFPFVSGLLAADYSASFEHLALPAAILPAVITHGGELTPRYRNLEEALTKETR
ncbi:MAG: hypothetical protein K0U98_12570 [Deltaproteobacteria bacterium]|nr:hypothetical protein [Deltaproteobacteria bacterium]